MSRLYAPGRCRARAVTSVIVGILALVEPAGAQAVVQPDRDSRSTAGTRTTPSVAEIEAARENLLADLDAIEATGATIGEIVVRVSNVFNPEQAGEDRWGYRMINRLHRRTRDSTVRQMLLFQHGDRFSRHAVEESERLLRQMRYLYDAEVRPLRFDGETVDMVVETRDVWSLKGGASFSRSGGKNGTRFGIEDENFLGWGKSLAIKRKSNVDRTSLIYRYLDPAVLGSRVTFAIEHQDSSDGMRERLEFIRPFFALDSRWSAGGRVRSEDRVDSLYSLGKVQSQFRHEQRFAEVFGGWSGGLRRGRARRWTAGFTYVEDVFGPAPGVTAVAAPPEDRTLAYPWVQFSSLRDGYIEVRQLDKIDRTEDLNLGSSFTLRLGVAADTFGADRSETITDLRYSSGRAPGIGQLLVWSAHAGGRYGSGQERDAVVGAQVRYYLRDWAENALFMKLEVDVASNLDPEHQLLLGGDSGLRGYPLRYLEGDRRVLMTMEQRFYTKWDLFKFFRVGAAIFGDAGSAWFASGRPNESPGGLLRDVGVGLRLGSTRSSQASMIHIDLAVPLDGNSSISSVQFLVTTKETF